MISKRQGNCRSHFLGPRAEDRQADLVSITSTPTCRPTSNPRASIRHAQHLSTSPTAPPKPLQGPHPIFLSHCLPCSSLLPGVYSPLDQVSPCMPTVRVSRCPLFPSSYTSIFRPRVPKHRGPQSQERGQRRAARGWGRPASHRETGR